jgi:hypothetical protein
MNEEQFAELLNSVYEGAEIMQGKREPARTYQVSASELAIFLREQRRQALDEQSVILDRYQANTLAALQAKIASGEVAEHPAWEDLITVETLAARLAKIDTLLAGLPPGHSPEG